MKESLKSEHAESYPGRPLPAACTCEPAKVEPTADLKELRKKQLGENGYIGN